MHTFAQDSGQSILEYLMSVLLVMVVLFALLSVWDGYRRDSVNQDSMLGKTITGTPFTEGSTLGISSQGVKDVLAH